MNDRMAAEFTREIVLAQESDFRVAETEVRPSSLEVSYQGEAVALEPRVMQVLVAVYRRRGQAVSRQELVESCWAGRVVTEGALNRSIGQLRKALRDPGIRIDTVPTVGYRLNAVDVPADLQLSAQSHASEPAEHAHSARDSVTGPPGDLRPDAPRDGLKDTLRRNFAILAIAMVVALGCVLWRSFATRPVIWTATAYRPLTYTPDQETFPALSADGRQIVYAARHDAYGGRELYLKNVNGGAPIQLTNTPVDNYGPAWSPDGDRIAFIRATDDRPCQLLVMPLPTGPERVVAQCESVRETRTSWLNAKTLVFADQPASSRMTRIRAVDIESGHITDLTSPPISTLGDVDPQAAPDGRHISFHRTLTFGADDLFVLDLSSGKERALTTDGWKASGYVWSADSRYVFFASNRGGDFGLWSVDREARMPPHRVSLGLGAVSFTRMSADRQNRLAVELPQGQGKLARLSLSGQVDVLTTGAGTEAEPAVAPDGSIAHVSNRSGFYELWLLSPRKEPLQLTTLQGSDVLAPAWSSDARRIAFIGVKGRRAEIFMVSREGTQLRQLTNDGAPKRDVVFSGPEDRLLYLARIDGRWKLMELPDEQSAPPLQMAAGENWMTLRAAPDGSVFGQREGEQQIRRIGGVAQPGGAEQVDEATQADVVDLVQVRETDVWAVGPEGVYVRRRSRLQPSTVWFFPWHQPGRKITDLPLAYGNLAVSPTGAVIFTQGTTSNIDLGMVELHPEG